MPAQPAVVPRAGDGARPPVALRRRLAARSDTRNQQCPASVISYRSAQFLLACEDVSSVLRMSTAKTCFVYTNVGTCVIVQLPETATVAELQSTLLHALTRPCELLECTFTQCFSCPSRSGCGEAA